MQRMRCTGYIQEGQKGGYSRENQTRNQTKPIQSNGSTVVPEDIIMTK